MKKAFTLIEILVVISIIGLLGGIFWANYQGSERHSQLTSARDTFLQNLRLAQSNALAGTELDGTIPSGGWGLRIDASSTTYVVFADKNGNQVYDEGEETSNIALPEGVEFYKVAGTVDQTDMIESELINAADTYLLTLPLDMVFNPQSKTLIIQDANSILVNAVIIFRETNEMAITSLFANSAGLLTIY